MKGFVLRKSVRYEGIKDPERVARLMESTDYYLKASRILPEDEEKRYCKPTIDLIELVTDCATKGYLSSGISSAFRGGAPLSGAA